MTSRRILGDGSMVWSTLKSEGRLGISGVSPLFGISGLSFSSSFLSAVLLFCLVLLLLSSLFSAFGPLACLLSRNFFYLFLYRDLLFLCVTLVFLRS